MSEQADEEVLEIIRRKMSNAPDAAAGQQDFIKGWPHPSLLEREPLKAALAESYKIGLDSIASTLNYGTKEDGAWMLGHPLYLSALSEFLTKAYGRPCPPETLMATGGSSMVSSVVKNQRLMFGNFKLILVN